MPWNAVRYCFITNACSLSSEFSCSHTSSENVTVCVYTFKKTVFSGPGDTVDAAAWTGAGTSCSLAPGPPDLDKNMLREALLGSVNEEGGSGSLLPSNSVWRAAGWSEK